MIELRGLTKKFGDFTAVDGLSFEIKTISGAISVSVQDKSGNTVFEKDNIETSTFEVEVPGEVRVCIQADGHRGSFKIRTTD